MLYKRAMMTPETLTFAVKSLYDSFSGLTLADWRCCEENELPLFAICPNSSFSSNFQWI